MIEFTNPITTDQMYGPWPIPDEDVNAALDRSRQPEPWTSLFDHVADLGVGATDVVLDIGARDAHHRMEIAARFGCTIIAVDPVDLNIQNAAKKVAAHDSGHLVDIRQGSIESIPAASDEIDVVFCRDMLNHVEDLDIALAECRRVLKDGGAMVVYQTFATPLLEPNEASRIYADLVIVPERMSTDDFERRVDAAGFSVEALDIVGSQWRESWEEDGKSITSKQLLHAARLIRCSEETLRELGEVPYRAELSDALWGVYQMIGKLEPRIYVLRG